MLRKWWSGFGIMLAALVPVLAAGLLLFTKAYSSRRPLLGLHRRFSPFLSLAWGFHNA